MSAHRCLGLAALLPSQSRRYSDDLATVVCERMQFLPIAPVQRSQVQEIQAALPGYRSLRMDDECEIPMLERLIDAKLHNHVQSIKSWRHHQQYGR